MKIPRFLLCDSTETPDELFVLHTEYPRFLIDLDSDEIEWFDDLEKDEEEDEMVNIIAHLIKEAHNFYENELKTYEEEEDF